MTNKIERVQEIRVLTSPLRQEIIDTIEARGGETTVSELASELGRPADGLYYHLKLLAKSGLLVELPGRNSDGRAERRYQVRKRREGPLTLEYRPKDRQNRKAVGGVIDQMVRIAARDFHRAFAREAIVVDGPRRELWAARSKGWVSEAELEAINRLLRRLNRRLRHRRSGSRDRLISVCFVLAPVQPKATRRKPAG